jgi:leucyl/phenylalanyl-tRNA--protein transferase
LPRSIATAAECSQTEPVGALDPNQMIRALAVGMFPMATARHADTIEWIEPTVRGIMPIDGFHASRTVLQKLRSERFTITVDRAFNRVVTACAEVTPARINTWINPSIEAACDALHRRGWAHSVECWRNGELVGGVFGISLGGLFAAESKFSRVSDASKMALAHLMVRLRWGGYRLFDCQFITPHLASLGAIEITQAEYRRLLGEALVAGGVKAAAPLAPASPSPIDFFALDRISEGEAGRPVPGRFIAQELVGMKFLAGNVAAHATAASFQST